MHISLHEREIVFWYGSPCGFTVQLFTVFILTLNLHE